MSMATLGDWTYSVDRDATNAAYKAVEHCGCETCECAYCRNFRLARAQVYPDSFLALLNELGIDPLKDGEVYQNYRVSPGCHDYGGWFHFVGTLQQDNPQVDLDDSLSVHICNSSAPRLASLEKLAVVELTFHASAVPWLLSEQEPD